MLPSSDLFTVDCFPLDWQNQKLLKFRIQNDTYILCHFTIRGLFALSVLLSSFLVTQHFWGMLCISSEWSNLTIQWKKETDRYENLKGSNLGIQRLKERDMRTNSFEVAQY